MPEKIKITKRWKEHLAYYKDTAKRSDEQTIQFTFHIFPGAKTNEIRLEIDEWIRQSKGEYGQQFTPETNPHQVILRGMVNEIPISSEDPKKGHATYLQDWERNAAYFGKFLSGYFMTIAPSSEETWKFEKYTDNPGRTRDELARQVTGVFLVQKQPILKGSKNLSRRRIQARWQEHAFQCRSRISKDDNGAHQFSQ